MIRFALQGNSRVTDEALLAQFMSHGPSDLLLMVSF